MISTTFSEAWAEGARKYRKWNQQEKLQVIPLKDAWRRYVPVTLAPAKYSLAPPIGNEVKALVDRERTVLISKSLDRFLVTYRSLLHNKPDDINARMQIGIIYGRNGLHDLASKEFDRVLQVSPQNSAAHNNRGNLYYIKGDYDRALEAYREAEAIDPKDGGIKVNLALVYYKLGNLDEAIAKHGEAVALDENIAKKYEAGGLQPYWKGDQSEDSDYIKEVDTFLDAMELADAGKFEQVTGVLNAFSNSYPASSLDPNVQFALGLAYGQLGKNPKVVAASNHSPNVILSTRWLAMPIS